MIQIPLQAKPSYRFKVLLKGQQCTIWLYQKGRYMYIDLMVGQSAIVQGALCQNLASIVQVANTSFKGFLIFLDTVGDTAPKWQELNSRYILLYLSEAEAKELGFTL